MATSGDDSMLNATLVSDLPPPMISNMNDNNSQQATPSSYQDLIKNLDIKQMTSGQSMPMPAAIQMQQQMPRQTQQQMPQQMMQQQMPQQMMQQPEPDNLMELLHAKSSTYPGTMPQSAPVGEYASGPSVDMAQGPIVNSLLPDPMFFNPPPRERKRSRQPPPPPPPPPPRQLLGVVEGEAVWDREAQGVGEVEGEREEEKEKVVVGAMEVAESRKERLRRSGTL